ncbi:DUF551 domain-containing protein [Klebsiella pneumoniae]
MTKSTITRERLQEIAEDGFLKHGESKELARMALAAMDSEPVAYISKADFDAGYPHILARRDFNKACTMAVYAATQPAPVVPELRVDWQENEFSAGWNACRASMLAAAPQSPGSEPATVPGKWIPVSERMPIEFEAVIAFDGDQVYGEAMYSSDDGFTIDGYEPCDRLNLQNVTHWMELPAAPQEVK